MPAITVTGLVPAEEFGMISPHEHIFCDYSEDYREPTEEIKRLIADLGVDLEGPITLKSYGILMRSRNGQFTTRFSIITMTQKKRWRSSSEPPG